MDDFQARVSERRTGNQNGVKNLGRKFRQPCAANRGGDEIDRLATAFNGMLVRIKQLVSEIRETNDNIAHELRSPITRIRGLAETTLAHRGSIEDLEAVSGNTIEECDRLLGLINTMLDIGEAETGVVKLEFKK